MSLEKIVILCWDSQKRAPAELGRVLLQDLAPKLLEAGAEKLQINVSDEHADVKSPALRGPFDDPFVAQVNVWLKVVDDRWPIEDVLRRAGFELAAYHVSESIYTDYGDNEHAGPRDWPDGARSPGILAVTCLERPKRIPKDEWMRRWHGRMSPVSERLQPRTRYVRNVVKEVLTHGAPVYDGIVEEAWPSKEHVENPFLFYRARNVFELARNMGEMLLTVTAFLNLFKIRTRMMSEYFVKS
ncbi:MAG: hypothetical protein GXY23_02950 [Myxococcales bacterium]|jgi:hypothetical protein|nr:hypothetical protein [Myxococcales bacterium]